MPHSESPCRSGREGGCQRCLDCPEGYLPRPRSHSAIAGIPVTPKLSCTRCHADLPAAPRASAHMPAPSAIAARVNHEPKDPVAPVRRIMSSGLIHYPNLATLESRQFTKTCWRELCWWREAISQNRRFHPCGSGASHVRIVSLTA